jgi:hypothetical protein
MRTSLVVLTVGILATGCAAKKPETPAAPQPQAVATPPAAPSPAATKPVAAAPGTPTATPKTTAPAAPTPAPPVTKAAPVTKAPATPARATKPAAPPAAAPPAAVAVVPVGPAPLDLIALKEELKATKAIGVFTKVSLKNKVDDLMAQFRVHYRGKTPPTMAELRQSYDLLIMKVLSLLQDSDKPLASKIVSSREAIWALLADPKRLAALDT